MKFREFLKIEAVRIPLVVRGKQDLIEKMIDVLVTAHKLNHRDQILTAVLERESLMSTGVGKGVAIPHGKVDGVNDVMGSFALITPATDFGSPDGEPVQIAILLIASTKETGPHIRALAHISRVLQDEEVRSGLLMCKSSKDVFDVLEKKEKEF